MRRAFACLASAAIICLSSQPAKAAERINLIYPSISGLILGLWVAKEANLFEKHGLQTNLVYIQSASAVMQAMLGGEAPVALACGKPVVDLGLEGGDAVFIGGITVVPAFYIMAVSEIAAVEQLRGKPVGGGHPLWLVE